MQEGFLFGRVKTCTTTSVEDHHEGGKTQSRVEYAIREFKSMGLCFSFYTTKGHVEVAKLRSLQHDQNLTLLGWSPSRVLCTPCLGG